MSSHETKIPVPESFKEWSEWDHKTFATEEERVAFYIEETRKHKWKIVSPIALGMGGWDIWKTELRKEFPIRTFIRIKIPSVFRKIFTYRIGKWLHDLKWKFIHRYVPKHQYNVLRPATLKPGYYDPCDRILHACMEELREYFEKGAPDISWDSDEHHAQVYSEMKEIYNWWTDTFKNHEDRLNKEYPFPDLPTMFYAFNPRHADEPIVIEWRRIADIHRVADDKLIEEEEQMLIRLMKIRKSMWYL